MSITKNCFRILPYNYSDIENLANYSVTSEDPVSFPITNAFNKQRRSKVWRSQGFFTVDASNNVIYFRENALGSYLSAAIAVDNYTSITSLAAAIKLAMDNAGANTYTVTHVQNRFRISSSGAYFEMKCEDALFTADELTGFYTNRTVGVTHTADDERIHSYERIVWDLGLATNPMCFCLTDSRNEPLKISPNAVVTLAGNHTNEWSSPAYSKVLDSGLYTMSVFSDSGLGDDSYRYWSLTFEDKKNPQGYVQIGSFYLGDYFDPDRGRPQFPLDTTLVDRSVTTFSEGGQSYSDQREQTAEYSVRWFALAKEDVEEFEKIWRNYGTSRPFWVSMDTSENFSSDRNNRIIFCKFSEPPIWSLIRSNIFELSLRLREEL